MSNENTTFADLLTPEEVRQKLGLRTQTNHTLRQFELRGLLRPVRLNARTLRYRPADVLALIERGAAA